ncbi:hypothetical protein [Actinoplanes siamensis]|uniref:Uncharacterized protein n=1 Tax=Actinoplanes siamensis TaxID=1223317 RepID=A0A919TN30_9ACTN|nr:hypothetical protein [Actinoplanes siamensis]GIF09021.1 hypothetical protein Asi03nite_65590 [Actinoplanes siamensis]
MAPKHRRALVVILVATVAVAGTIVITTWNRQKTQPAPAGDELETAIMQPYGWSGSKSIGTRFTDGLIHLRISPNNAEPIKIISVTPIMDNDTTLRVVGVLARVVPDMLPAGHEVGWFQQDKEFPPADHDNSGGIDPRGLLVQNSERGDDFSVEFQIGYDVVGNGKTSRSGVEVVYQYQGKTRRFVIPSHLSICAPASVKCSPEDD